MHVKNDFNSRKSSKSPKSSKSSFLSSKSEVYLQNYAALNAFFHSALHQLKIMKTNENQERRQLNTVEDMFSEGDNFSSEGERLETKGEMALSLAFYTNAASKFKQITTLNNLSSDVMLRAQIRRESCLKKARTMYRRLLVQSAQKTPQNNTEHNNLRSSRKTNQVRTERRPCNSCSKSCFWLKDGLCSDCDLRASELHRRTARRNVASRLNGPRDVSSRATVRDFTTPRVAENQNYARTRRTYDDSESNYSSEEEFAPVKSCAICHTHRHHQPSYHPTTSYRRRCC
ncbi:uncharacterized protein LOC134824008 isoform X2 [Bolinopsis microptera]|uniref:uncharacterized protein LOC134824008 isoform X2 n=1 Tax=Bolinopsis microptera TaxID=2820187 RepID=UPI003079DEB5